MRRGKTDLLSEHASDWPDHGVYQLFIRLPRGVRVRVGRLGVFEFPGGEYVYTGRASRGLRARVRCHLRAAKRRRWHVDYLLGADGARVVKVLLVSADADDECAANRAAGRKGVCVAAGFGASDCRCGCETHLWHLHRQRCPGCRLSGSPRAGR